MTRSLKRVASVTLIAVFIVAGIVPGDADDIDLFLAQIPPDALIVIDLSGSMKWTTAGDTLYISSSESCLFGGDVAYYLTSGTGHTKVCNNIDPDDTPKYSDTSCSGPPRFGPTDPGESRATVGTPAPKS